MYCFRHRGRNHPPCSAMEPIQMLSNRTPELLPQTCKTFRHKLKALEVPPPSQQTSAHQAQGEWQFIDSNA